MKETRLLTNDTLAAADYFESILFRGVKLEQLKKPFMTIYDCVTLPLFTTERTPCIAMPRKILSASEHCCTERIKVYLCAKQFTVP